MSSSNSADGALSFLAQGAPRLVQGIGSAGGRRDNTVTVFHTEAARKFTRLEVGWLTQLLLLSDSLYGSWLNPTEYQLDTEAHSAYSLHYHPIFTDKYRRGVLTEERG